MGDLGLVTAQLQQVLVRHASSSTVVSERRSPDGGVDVAYRILMRDPSRSHELQSALAHAEGLTNVSVFMHDDEAEI
jgi:hypothetical protein